MSVSAPALLAPDEPPPFEQINADGTAPVLLVCDHASNRVPRVLGDLGLPPERLGEHIGWDIGAAIVTRLLAPMLAAPALLCGYSRLVVDCNRDTDDPSSIPESSDGVEIPANLNLTPEQRAARLGAIFHPYHGAIRDRLDRFFAAGRVPAVVSIHSFTPVMGGFVRPWHVGILWDRDGRIPMPLLGSLGAEAKLNVGDNQPYSARDPVGFTIFDHAERRGLPHVAIEIRQDLIGEDAGAEEWAIRLANALQPILANPAIYHVEHF